jgi:hypothetical protein
MSKTVQLQECNLVADAGDHRGRRRGIVLGNPRVDAIKVVQRVFAKDNPHMP